MWTGTRDLDTVKSCIVCWVPQLFPSTVISFGVMGGCPKQPKQICCDMLRLRSLKIAMPNLKFFILGPICLFSEASYGSPAGAEKLSSSLAHLMQSFWQDSGEVILQVCKGLA